MLGDRAPIEPAGHASVAVIARRDEFDKNLLKRLRRCGKRLPERLRIEITSYGERGVRPLCAVLGADGWGPVHAVRLIGEMGAERAIGPLIQALRETESGDPLHEEIHHVLERLGERVVEPALLAHDAFRGEEVQDCLAEVLARTGVRDERILALLLGMLETSDPVLAACLLAEYGDARALAALSRALDETTIEDPAPRFQNQAAFEIASAIEDLGGALTPSQAAQVERAEAAHRRFFAPPVSAPARRPERPGRNDPCWCGSGRKYKRCHLDADNCATA
ncbi:MAG TPA: SEC-C domain-containing protein [Planctomycetota bacterium]|nr:SEC-C domain-containing protein [Planctomycetota bacterium]